MKTTLILALLLIAYGVVGRMDYEDALAIDEERQELAEWLQQNCVPNKPHQRSVSEMRSDGSIQCAKYENAGGQQVPRLIFAEVRK